MTRAAKPKPITTDDKSKVVVDAVVLSHFFVGNLCILLGKFTTLLDGYKLKFGHNGGIDFLYHVLDAPVYYMLTWFLGFYYWVLGFLQKEVLKPSNLASGDVESLVFAECVVLVGSVFYGMCTYLAIRGWFKILGK